MNDQNTAAKRPLETSRAGQAHLPVEPTLGDVANDAMESFRQYAIRRPEVVAAWCFGAGFVFGWKLKPW